MHIMEVFGLVFILYVNFAGYFCYTWLVDIDRNPLILNLMDFEV